MKYIDTHAHYNDKVYKDNLNEVLNKVKDANVDKIVNIGYDKDSSLDSINLAKKYDYIYSSIGVHPHDVNSFNINNLEQLYDEYKEYIVAIGEIGLDYAFVKDNKELQKKVFLDQIKFAEKVNLPIVIHSRDASLDTYNMLKDNISDNTKVLIHCFSPTDDLVRLVLSKGYTVAFGGNITFKRNESFKKYIEMIPLNQIVIETDCPYLSPVPFRGKVNDSSNLKYINAKLAEYKKVSEEEMAKITYENACKFFGI